MSHSFRSGSVIKTTRSYGLSRAVCFTLAMLLRVATVFEHLIFPALVGLSGRSVGRSSGCCDTKGNLDAATNFWGGKIMDFELKEGNKSKYSNLAIRDLIERLPL